MKDMILFPEDIDRLNTVLNQLTIKANLLLSVLVNKDGRLLTSQGILGNNVDTVSMGALIAGNSASTLAIANIIGESEFSAMYHQGKERHIYIAVVDENTFLCLIFDNRTNIDRVKVFVRQFDRQIKKALSMVYSKTEDQVDLDLGLDENDRMNNAFSDHASFPVQETPVFQPQEYSSSPSMPIDHHNIDPASPPQQHTPIVSNGSSEIDDAVHISEMNAQQAQKEKNTPHDTNYLYLKKKIRETVKRKK